MKAFSTFRQITGKSVKWFLTTLFIVCNTFANAQSPGIECGCEKYDQYKTPASKNMSAVQESASKNGKYQVTVTDAASSDIVNITIFYNGKVILNVSSTATAWGFSPDEDKFVMHGFDEHNWHWCTLYNLNPNPTREGEDAEEFQVIRPVEVSSARIRFSPHGKYLLYAAIGNSGNLLLNIFNTTNGDLVYDGSTSTPIVGEPSGKSVAGWGFSPDNRDRTFVHAIQTDAQRFNLFVKNLERPEGKYVLKALNNTGGAAFRFSPCGDYFLWIQNDATCNFYKTSEENSSPDETASGTGMNYVFTKDDGHYISYNNGDEKIFDNSSNNDCDDDTPPVWTDAVLTVEKVTGTHVFLKWNEATDSGGGSVYYTIYKDDSEVGEVKDSLGFDVNDLTPEKKYTFIVKAHDEAGNWTTNNPSVSVTTKHDNPPEWTAGNLSAPQVEGVKMLLEWSGAADDFDTLLTYRIFVDGDKVEDIYGETSYWLTGLDPSTSYSIKIEAGDEADQWTTNGPQLTQSTAADNPPTWPAGAEIVVDSITMTSIEFHWPEATDDWGVKEYQGYRDGQLIFTLNRGNNSFTDENLEKGTVYSYLIKAIDEAGNSSAFLTRDISTKAPFVVSPLIAETGVQSVPDIDDNLIVWQDTRTGHSDIYLYDLKTKQEKSLLEGFPAVTQWQGFPAISGYRIAWADGRSGAANLDIYASYPTGTGNAIKQITTDSGEQTIPQIDGNQIVWADMRSGDWDIYMYDLGTMQETAICSAPGKQTNPSISNGLIVWEDYRNGNADIYGYKTYTGEEFVVCDDPHDQINPVASGYTVTSVFWQDNRLGKWNIYIYSYLSYTDKPSILKLPLGDYSNQTNPDYDHEGEQLVYVDDKNGSADIYAIKFRPPYNLFDREIVPVCTEDGDQVHPRTSKGRIVWEDRRSDDGDIYIWDRPPGTDLTIDITDTFDPVMTGKSFKYIVTATNLGPDDEDSAKVTCHLPLDAILTDTTASKGEVACTGHTLEWNVGLMPNDSTAVLEVTLQTFTNAILTFSAQIEGKGFDSDPSNNRAEETTYVKEFMKQELQSGDAPSMYVERSGVVHLFYAQDSNLVYAERNLSGIWNYTYLEKYFAYHDTTSNINSSAIFVHENGDINILYSETQNPVVIKNPSGGTTTYTYEYWSHILTKLNGEDWKNRLISKHEKYNRLFGDNISIGSNRPSNIHALFHWNTGYTLKLWYLHYDDGKCSDVTNISDESYGNVGMAFDNKGFAHVSYISINKGITYRMSNDTIISSWLEPYIIEPAWRGVQLEFLHTDIGVDSLGNPHIVYPGATGNNFSEDIKHAWKDNNGWHYEMIDEGATQSGANAIVVEPSGVVHVSYMYVPDGELRYATNIAGPWIKQTLTKAEWVNELDMGNDNSGNIHIMYNDMYGDAISYIKKRPIHYFKVNNDTIDFGTVEVDTCKTIWLKMLNPGTKPIDIDSVFIIDNTAFKVDFNEMTLYEYMEDSIAVTFSPKENMKVETYLRIYYDGASQLFMDIPVLAKTPIPELNVSPNPVDLGYVAQGETKTDTVVLTNTGAVELDISNIEVKYDPYGTVYPTDFNLAGHNCNILAPDESCEVRVSLTPTRTGSHRSFLQITSNAYESGLLKISLTGKTSSAQINADQTDIYFGYVEAGQTETKTVKIFNTGQIDLAITSSYISGTDSSEFSVINTCSTIPPGDTCEFEVSFIPDKTGDFEAALGIVSNSGTLNPLPISLHGTSIWIDTDVNPANVNFGDIAIGDDSVMTVQLASVDTSQLVIYDSSIEGDDNMEFHYSMETDTLSSNSTINFNVTFRPYFSGYKSAFLRINSNDSDEGVIEIPLTGYAVDESNPRHDISGSVVTPDEDTVTEGTVVVCNTFENPNNTNMWWKPLEGVDVFSFIDIPQDSVTIRIDPDAVSYPGYLRTYLGDKLLYSDAEFFYLDKDTSGLKITLIPKPENSNGTSETSGIVIQEEGTGTSYLKAGRYTGTGVPLRDIPVMLKGSDGKIIAYDITDEYGEFNFVHLNPGHYDFFADYPGFNMDKATNGFDISGDNKQLYITAVAIDKNISVEVSEATATNDMENKYKMNVYPNPVSDNIYININSSSESRVYVNLYRIDGKLIKNTLIDVKEANTLIRIPVSDIKKGLYILKVQGKQINFTTKVVKQ